MDTENNGPMDAEQRTDAALAAFEGTDDKTTDTTQQTTDGQQVTDAAKDTQQVADAGAGDKQEAPTELTDEQLQADPRFQALSELRDQVNNVFSEYGIPTDDKGNPDMKEAGLQLADANVLYQIAQGKAEAAQLMDTFLQVWPKDAIDRTAQSLIGWLSKQGYLKEGQAAAGVKGGEKQGAKGEFKDPLAEEVKSLKDREAERERTAEQQKVQAHQKEVFETKFIPSVNKFCEQKGIPKEDWPDYAGRIAAGINGNKAILARIEKDNFVDVQRLFTQIHNAEVARLQRWTTSQTAAAQKKQAGNPRLPAGGAPPAPAGSAKPLNTKNRDERIAAATEML